MLARQTAIRPKFRVRAGSTALRQGRVNKKVSLRDQLVRDAVLIGRAADRDHDFSSASAAGDTRLAACARRRARSATDNQLARFSLSVTVDAMNQHDPIIVTRCRELGIDQHGLVSITNFVRAAMYHIALPGTLPADQHLAIDNAVRRATNRIACQGRHGDSRSMSRVLSRGALRLREAVLADPAIPVGKKLAHWRLQVTDEHQEPVREVERRWVATPDIAAETIVGWLLERPSAIILREEERRIANAHRHSGAPEERYAEPGIIIELVELGAADFFAQGRMRRQRNSAYHVERLPFADA